MNAGYLYPHDYSEALGSNYTKYGIFPKVIYKNNEVTVLRMSDDRERLTLELADRGQLGSLRLIIRQVLITLKTH